MVDELVAKNEEAGIRAIRDHLERMKELETREQAALEAGRGTRADTSEVSEARLEAELNLRKAMEARKEPGVEALKARVEELERRLQALEQRKPANLKR